MASSVVTHPISFDEYDHSTDVPWFAEKPELWWPARQLLEKYSGIPPEDVEREVIAVRNRAWRAYPFPCIGAFDFLDLQLSTRNILYPKLLGRLQAGASFLDIGCCLGTDIRKLVFDGVPAQNLVGVELRQQYIDLGFDLFRDRNRLGAKIFQADVLSSADADPWPQLDGAFEIVNFGMILHCFTREEQAVLFERAIRTLKHDRPGTSIIGLACGTVDGTVENWAGKEVLVHNEDTFKRLVADVEARTDTRWEVDVELDTAFSTWIPKYHWVNPRVRRLVFELTRLA